MTPELEKKGLENIQITEDTSLSIPKEFLNERKTLREELQGLFYALLVENRLPPRSIPRPLTESRRNPLEDLDYLSKSLIPPGQYRTGTILESTQQDISERAESALANHKPLIFHAEMASCKWNMVHDSTVKNSPQFGEYLYLRQLWDYVENLSNYPHGTIVQAQIDDIGDQFILKDIAKASRRELTDLTYGEGMKNMVDQGGFSTNIKLVSTSQNPDTEEYFGQLETSYRKIKDIWQNSIPLFEEFVQRSGGVHYWRYYFNRSSPSAFAGQEDNEEYWREGHPWFDDWIDRLKSNYGDLSPWLDELTPPYISRFIDHFEWIVGSNPPFSPTPSHNRDHSTLATDATFRFIARTIALNERYSQKNQIGDHNVISNIYAGDLYLYPRNIIKKYGLPISLSGFKKTNSFTPFKENFVLSYSPLADRLVKPSFRAVSTPAEYKDSGYIKIGNLSFLIPISRSYPS